MAMTEREKKWTLTDEEIEAKIADFREKLEYCRQIYTELLNDGVFANFYLGTIAVHGLPDKCNFKRNRLETFG